MANATNNIIETRLAANTKSERLLKEISASVPKLVYQYNAAGEYLFAYDSEGAGSLLRIEPCVVNENVNGFDLVQPDDLASLFSSINVFANTLELIDNEVNYSSMQESPIIEAGMNCINDTRPLNARENDKVKYGQMPKKNIKEQHFIFQYRRGN